jgi:hypothetical protein
MTKLEMLMPISWNSAVIHIFLCQALQTLEGAVRTPQNINTSLTGSSYTSKQTGPFPDANMLDIERFQTVFKSLARSPRDVMVSIRNHYMILDVSLNNRYDAQHL